MTEHGLDAALATRLARAAHAAYLDRDEALAAMAADGHLDATFIEAAGTEAVVGRLPADAGGPMLVVAFRGTKGYRDVVTDALVGRDTVAGHGCDGCLAHAGFAHALDVVWRDGHGADSTVPAVVTALLAAHGPMPVHLTGHSLGGALAVLAAHRFATDTDVPVTAVHTFGSPRVGNRALARHTTTTVHRIVNGRDHVARVPPWLLGFRHVGTEHWFRDGAVDPFVLTPDAPVARRLRWWATVYDAAWRFVGLVALAAVAVALLLAWAIGAVLPALPDIAPVAIGATTTVGLLAVLAARSVALRHRLLAPFRPELITDHGAAGYATLLATVSAPPITGVTEVELPVEDTAPR